MPAFSMNLRHLPEKNSIESFGTEGQFRFVLFLLNVGALCDNLDIIQVFMINWKTEYLKKREEREESYERKHYQEK